MKRYEESFKSKLIDFNFETIENSRHAVFGLSANLTFIYFNPAWYAFALANFGEPVISKHFPLGASFESAVSGELKAFYVENYKTVIKERKVWKHEYECSTSSLRRLYYQECYPLKNGEGIIVVNSLITEHLMEEAPVLEISAKQANYINENGLISQCSNCRKVQRPFEPETWDWVPALVSYVPENVSHTICSLCYDYYWKIKPWPEEQ